MLSEKALEELGDYMNDYFLSEENFCKIVKKKPIFHWERKPTKSQKNIPLNKNEKIDYFWNAETCEKSNYINKIADSDNFRIMEIGAKGQTGYGTERAGYYMEYLEDFDVVVFGRARIKGNAVTSKNEDIPRQWYPNGEFFIDRDKNMYCVDKHWDYYSRKWIHGKIKRTANSQYLPFKFNDIRILEEKGRESGMSGGTFKDFSAPILNLFSEAVYNVGANHTVDITKSVDSLIKFLKYKEPSRRSGPKQKRIDELVSIKLPKIEYSDDYAEKIAFIHKVDDGMCVLRTMYKDEHKKIIRECARIYISLKECLSCRPNNLGEWVNMKLNSDIDSWNFSLVRIDDGAVCGTKLEYFEEIMNDVPLNLQGKLIWVFLSEPIFEQIAKAGGKEFVLRCVEEMEFGSPLEVLRRNFGKIKDGRKLTDRIGVNKYQLKKILEIANVSARYPKEKSWDRYWTMGVFIPLPVLKLILSGGSVNHWYTGTAYGMTSEDYVISDIDNKTFNILLEASKKAYALSSKDDEYVTFANILGKIKDLYGMQTMLKMLPKVRDITGITKQEQFRGHTHTVKYSRMYYDFLVMAGQIMSMDDAEKIKCDFDSNNIDTILAMHDELSAAITISRSELETRGFKSHAEKSNKLEFSGEKNDEFMVIAPKEPVDLVNEGVALHHCVGSYVRRVAMGETNILFLRKKEDPDTSFYTIEVTNDGSVQQIHGVCNVNIQPNSPEEKFIRKWISKKHLRKTNWNKVR